MPSIVVHPTDSLADHASLTPALQQAQHGDVILLEPGLYGPSSTGEQLPLRIPAGVAVEGSGADGCTLDGEGQFAPSFNPIRAEESVAVVEDGASLSGVTVTNGGGHGIGVPVGASVTIRNCTLSQHGDHGIFVGGATEAIITQCVFQRNGLQRFEPQLPRGTGARQGHHIFAEARHGQRNQLVITDNTMQECFADGIAFVCFFPEPDGVSFGARILRNTIEASERGGLLFSCSFGPSQNQYQVLAADNILKNNKQFGINILTAVPLADRVPQHNKLYGVIAGNHIFESPIGIAIQGAVSEARHNSCVVTLDRNQISDCAKNDIRLVGATGVDGVVTQGNAVTATVSRNDISGSVVIQGAGGPAGSTLHGNTATVRVHGNTGTNEQSVRVSNGAAGNTATIAAGSQAAQRTDDNLL